MGQVTEYFEGVFGIQRQTTPEIPDFVPRFENPPDVSNPFQFDMPAGEIWNRLKICHNTAPGPGGIRYATWKKLDEGAHILAAVYGALRRIGTFPKIWKESKTVLIFKKGDEVDLANWRPIIIGNTITKSYSAVLAKRLDEWATNNGRLSPAQKRLSPDGWLC